MRCRIAYIITFILIYQASFSQTWSTRRYEFYCGIGLSNFMGDIAAPTNSSKYFWVNFYNTIGITANTGLKYMISDRSYIRGSMFLGQLYAEDVVGNTNFYYRGYKINTFFTELAFKYEFHIIKEKERKTVYKQLGQTKLKNFNVPTYIFIGAGGLLNTGKFSQASGLELFTDNYTNLAFVIPIGLGVKFRLNHKNYANIEFGTRLSLSDGIDNAKGKDNKQFGTYPDQYQFITINYIHKLKSNEKGWPRFKKR